MWENKDCAGSYLWPQTSNLCCPWEKVCGLLLWMLLNFTLYNWFSAIYFRWVLGYLFLFILLLICWVSWPYWFTIFKKFGRFFSHYFFNYHLPAPPFSFSVTLTHLLDVLIHPTRYWSLFFFFFSNKVFFSSSLFG